MGILKSFDEAAILSGKQPTVCQQVIQFNLSGFPQTNIKTLKSEVNEQSEASIQARIVKCNTCFTVMLKTRQL